MQVTRNKLPVTRNGGGQRRYSILILRKKNPPKKRFTDPADHDTSVAPGGGGGCWLLRLPYPETSFGLAAAGCIDKPGIHPRLQALPRLYRRGGVFMCVCVSVWRECVCQSQRISWSHLTTTDPAPQAFQERNDIRGGGGITHPGQASFDKRGDDTRYVKVIIAVALPAIGVTRQERSCCV